MITSYTADIGRKDKSCDCIVKAQSGFCEEGGSAMNICAYTCGMRLEGC